MPDARTKRIAAAVLLAHVALIVVLLIVGKVGGQKLLPIEISFDQASDGRRSVVSAPKTSSVPTALPQPAATREASSPDLKTAPFASSAAPNVNVENTVNASAPSGVQSLGLEDRQPTVDASYSGNPLPEYPAMSRRLGEQGTVVLKVLIGADGTAGDVQVVRSSGSARLDRSAIDTIRKWRFVPAAKGGKPVASWYEWQWEFRLR